MWDSRLVAVRALLSASLLAATNAVEVHTGVSNYSFPDDFILGVSTAAFQIEGAWNEGGKGESMWDTYLHQHPDFTVDKQNGDVATDSYHRYKDDIAIIKHLGVKYYRMSISWPRILPNGFDNYINPEGVKYYRTLFEELIKENITIAVTLYHWDMPTGLMDLGGWGNPKIIDYFEDYARVIFNLYGDIIKLWITINEPHQHCSNGYGLNSFVPALMSHGVGEYLCMHYMLLSHAKVYHLYNNEFRPKQKGKIGITLDAFWGEPKDSNKKEDWDAAERYMQMHMGLFAHPIFSEEGDYPKSVRQIIDRMSLAQNYTRSRLPVFSAKEIDLVRGSADFFGLNHYTTYEMTPSEFERDWMIPSLDHDTGVRYLPNPSWKIPGAHWLAIYPPGFRRLVNWITNNYGKGIPIIVTENGMCDWGGLKDYDRVSYFNEYLYQLLLAIHEDGCNVQGYFAWTLMDDFEWNDGYRTKFGLYHIDFNSPERTRTPKLSAYNYRQIVRKRTIDFDYIKPPPGHSDLSSNKL